MTKAPRSTCTSSETRVRDTGAVTRTPHGKARWLGMEVGWEPSRKPRLVKCSGLPSGTTVRTE